MNKSTKKEVLEQIEETNGDKEVLHLELNIQNSMVIKYLTGFEESLREDKALEALKVGVIAIQSASPTLDTRVVEEKFQEIERRIDRCVTNFRDEAKTQLEEYFKKDSGSVPRFFENLFGENGILTQKFNQYFGPDTGKVVQLLQQHIGPSSQFAKSLDPNNKESVISRIEEGVKRHVEEKSNELVKQFSLDSDNSALSRLKTAIAKEVETIKNSNNKFFVELREALGIKTGKELEAEKGTGKGREFETVLYDQIAEMGRSLGDSTDNVRAIVGSIPRSKKGDYVICLGETSGAPGRKIVIEAKKEQGFRLKDAIDELKEAKENREAEAGIFVFAKGYEPPEIGDFHRIGEDFFITVDEKFIENRQPLLFFEAAYKIVRALIVTTARREVVQELDLDRIKRELDSLVALVERLSELSTKAKTISTNSKFIEDTISKLKDDMESRLNDVLNLLNRSQITP